MAENILTIDAGTTGLKCSLIGSNGRLLAYSLQPYEICYSGPGWAEQPVSDTIAALCRAVCDITAQYENPDIAVIGLSGTMNGCIPVDANGQILYPNIIHSDMRAVSQLDEIRAVICDSDYYQRTGNRLDAHYMLPKLLWLKKSTPQIYQKARWFINIKDALRGFLTGVYGATDYSDASLTGALNIQSREWDAALLDSLALDKARMPDLLVSHEFGGYLTKETAQILFLKPGIPVTIGAGDGACATHGAGVCAPLTAYCNIGSSAWLAALSPSPVIDKEMRVFNFIDMDGRLVNVCGTVQCGAESLDWAAKNLLFRSENKIDYSELESLTEQSEAGAKGVFFLPTLMGERTPWWDTDARGTLVGMTLRHTGADMARSLYEGICEALHLCGDVFDQNGMEIRSITLVGGGSQSKIWPQMFADMFDVPVRVHRYPRAATSLGAAIAAGVGAGIFKDYRDAARIVEYNAEMKPDCERHKAYSRHFEVYRTLYGRFKDAYKDISRYQSNI